MGKNVKQTSTRVAKLAAETLQDPRASQVARSLAASALAQRGNGRQTGAVMEDVAARVLAGSRYADQTKELSASVLAQANKAR